MRYFLSLALILTMTHCSSVKEVPHATAIQTPLDPIELEELGVAEKDPDIIHKDSISSNLDYNSMDEKFSFCADGIYSSYLKHQPKLREKVIKAHIEQFDLSEDIPINLHSKVLKWIVYFQTRGKMTFLKWHSNGTKVTDTIKKILKSYNLPQDLVYLSMIESGFNNRAYSRVKATGAWQFMPATAKIFGLKITPWMDERRNILKATHAAAKYLKYLYNHFNDWHLALAAYNAGEGKVRRAIRRYRTRNFWRLTRYSYLKDETKNFVPKFLAAMIVSKNPRMFGFDLESLHIASMNREPEHTYIDIPHSISLHHLSRQINVSYKTLKNMNPELRSSITPPDSKHYVLAIPKGYEEKAINVIRELPEIEIRNSFSYKIKRGDTIAKLAYKYHSSIHKIITSNPGLDPYKLRIGRFIYIPTKAKPYAVKKTKNTSSAKIYRIKAGDTLSNIANRYKVEVKELLGRNNITNPDKIQPGQLIEIY